MLVHHQSRHARLSFMLFQSRNRPREKKERSVICCKLKGKNARLVNMLGLLYKQTGRAVNSHSRQTVPLK